jgi:Alpha/beta hydrolase domain
MSETVQRRATLRPMPGRIPMPAGAYDLDRLGYAEQEFLLDGTADSFQFVGERGQDGRWQAQADVAAPFVTRVLVRRPADPAAFSGTLVVEWLNVSGGIDAPPDWMLAHTQLIRAGHAWAGVSAQRAGIDGGGLVDNGMHLKQLFPDRYGGLVHPGDAWSFDMFSQAGRALVAGDAAPLGELRAERVLASGHSQSAAFLVMYINAIDRQARFFDGFLVHGRPGTAASLDTGFTPRRTTSQQPQLAGGEQIRADTRVPVLILQTETDLTSLGGGSVGQHDAGQVRQWELAGAAHADTYLLFASGHDDGALPAGRLAELLRPTTDILMATAGSPVNSGPQQHYVECAAIEALHAWVADGSAPASSPRLVGADFARDSHGIAVGGIRTPWTDAPVAALSGTGQTGDGFAFLFGTTRQFGAAELAGLYPDGLAGYLARFERSLDDCISAGFILAADRAEILALGQASWPGG